VRRFSRGSKVTRAVVAALGVWGALVASVVAAAVGTRRRVVVAGLVALLAGGTVLAETGTAGAATLHVHLKVINMDRAGITVTICAVNVTCKAPAKLGFEQSADMAAGRVNGSLVYADGFRVDFEAYNPIAAAPWIKVTDLRRDGECFLTRQSISTGQGRTCQLSLSVGETRNATIAGYRLTGKRTGDTNYKNMTLTAYGQPPPLTPLQPIYLHPLRPIW
jgi:hypothetical protein